MNDQIKIKRPVLVLLILIIAIFSSIGVIMQCLWALGAVKPPSELNMIFTGLGPLYYVLNVSAYLMYLVSAILLFRLNKSAILWFSASFILTIVVAIYQFVNTELLMLLNENGYFGFAFSLIILGYMVYLSKKCVIN